jgi:hypothetical protein
MDSLPAGSDWEIYVSVRVDAGTAAPGDVAIEAGVWTGPSTRTYPTIADIGDGDYHEIRIPGVHQYTSGGLIYVAPPANPAVTSVWVDRVFAVKV